MMASNARGGDFQRRDRIVVAIGGNALQERGKKLNICRQKENVATAVSLLKPLLEMHKVTVVHGNGPQVGYLALMDKQSPLDILDAESEGMIGYLLEQEIINHISDEKMRGTATVLSQIVVDPEDPAFDQPTKFVGPQYRTEEEAQNAMKSGQVLKRDGPFLRRVVPSPKPKHLIEHQLIALKHLVEKNCIVICAGGGGVPVLRDPTCSHLTGVEAVIDKDLSAAMIATEIEANGLLILTDVRGVAIHYGDVNNEKWIKSVSPDVLATLMDHFMPGSMRPKVEAAITFTAEQPFNFCPHFDEPTWCKIGALKDCGRIISGKSGTTVTTLYGTNHIVYYNH